MTDADVRRRCGWCGSDPLYIAYHDTEWGVPEYDDRALFEKLILDGFQAGLSWITILRKRDAFRRAFDGFDPERIARYDEAKVAALMADAGIVRNRAKIVGTIASARAYLALQGRGGLSRYLWDLHGGAPLQPCFAAGDIPTTTALSVQISRELKRLGFAFCGSTIVYAFLQACGFTNDHVVTCFRATTPAGSSASAVVASFHEDGFNGSGGAFAHQHAIDERALLRGQRRKYGGQQTFVRVAIGRLRRPDARDALRPAARLPKIVPEGHDRRFAGVGRRRFGHRWIEHGHRGGLSSKVSSVRRLKSDAHVNSAILLQAVATITRPI